MSRDLEVIFMQNNRREIKPPKDEMEKKESEALSGQIEDGQEESQEDDDGNWKRRKNIKNDNGTEDLDDKK